MTTKNLLIDLTLSYFLNWFHQQQEYCHKWILRGWSRRL